MKIALDTTFTGKKRRTRGGISPDPERVAEARFLFHASIA